MGKKNALLLVSQKGSDFEKDRNESDDFLLMKRNKHMCRIFKQRVSDTNSASVPHAGLIISEDRQYESNLSDSLLRS